jgi:four helix bundle protein
MLKSFRDLDFYQDAYQLALEVHRFTLTMPACEQVGGLASQMQRASKRIPAVIAEGWGRKENPKEFKHFLIIAASSGEEMQVGLDFCRDLEYLDAERHRDWRERYQSVIRRVVAFSKRWERFE